MTEAEMAERRRFEGFRTVCYKNRFWESVHHGFYVPIHTMARLEERELGRPSFFCWGLRATLRDGGAAANGVLPMHLLTDAAGYTMESLPAKRRSDLRKCLRLVKIVRLTGPAVLMDEGFRIVSSAKRRTKYDYGRYFSEDRFGEYAKYFTTDPKHVVLAGLVEEKLAGFLIGYAVGKTAYIKALPLDSAYLPTAISTGLVYEFAQVCRRSGIIEEVSYGQETPEDSSLGYFKEGLGFPVVKIPTRFWFPKLILNYIRRKAPEKFYRLTGAAAGPSQAHSDTPAEG